MDVMMVNKNSCDESRKWSEDLKAGLDEDDLLMPEDMDPSHEPDKHAKEERTYERISRDVFESYNQLMKNTNLWLDGVGDKKAIQTASMF